MIRTIVYVCMNTYYREATQNTGFHSFFDTFAYCRNVFLRNSTTNYSRFEFVSFFCVCIHWLKFNFTVTILSTSTGLFCIFMLNVNRFCDGLFVCNLRSTNVSLYLEFSQQTVNDDIQMQLTHTCDDCLTSFLIGMSTESRIFLCQFCQSFTQFTLSGFCLRLDSQLDNRFREFHGLQDYRMLIITDGITGSTELESDRCCDISGVNFVQLLTFVSVHLQDTSYTFFFIFCSI